jgi:hypothetical protein
MIYKHEIEFMEKAKKHFEENARAETYRNEDATHIALRTGWDRDSILIYRLDGEVACFAQIMDKAPELVLKEEEK